MESVGRVGSVINRLEARFIFRTDFGGVGGIGKLMEGKEEGEHSRVGFATQEQHYSKPGVLRGLRYQNISCEQKLSLKLQE